MSDSKRTETRSFSRDNDDSGIEAGDLTNRHVVEHMGRRLPQTVMRVGHWFKAVVGTPTTEGTEGEALARRVAQRWVDAVVRNTNDLPEAVQDMLGVSFVTYGVDPSAVRCNLPFNSGYVRAGGYAVLGTVTDSEVAAQVMAVDPDRLGADLAQHERNRSLSRVVAEAQDVLDANDSQVLSRIGHTVDEAVRRGESIIRNDGLVGRRMAPALAIRERPAEKAQATKAENQRRADGVRAEEKARLEKELDRKPGAQTTITATTETPPPPRPTK